jgi:hypothetical protein
MGAQTLNNPINMPNITKVEIDVDEFVDKRSAAVDPRISITLHFQGVGGRDAGTHTITARNVANSNPILLNAAPAGYGDVILSGGIIQIDGACTMLGDAYDAAYDTAYDASGGGRQSKKRAGEEAGRNAALVASQTLGLISAGLASSSP